LTAIVLLVFFLKSPNAWASEPVLHENDFVAMCGDSITEQRLYAMFIEDYLLMCKPAGELRASQFGWNGDSAEWFSKRMANNVVPFKPSVVTTCFGMNDGVYGPMTDAIAKHYRDAQRSIVGQFKKAGVRVIVIGSPGCLDIDKAFGGDKKRSIMYNGTLAGFRDIDREIAKEEGVLFANVHDAMIGFMTKAKAKYGDEYTFSQDGGHPQRNGHLVMAYAFLKALGCDGNIGTITIDLGKNEAQAAGGHKILSFKDGQAQVESSRYPFCFYGEPYSPDSTRGVLEFIPFNEELNRFMLIVKGLGSDKAKVTWGVESKVFARERLEKGINLAAEFLDNPFSEPFQKIEDKVAAQQLGEVALVKKQMNTIGALREMASQEKEALDRLSAVLVKRGQEARDVPAQAVAPVKHVIRIEPAK
jgi:lysophospholipase L1-like esterase